MFLTLEVVPIIACSKGDIWTSDNGTTSNEETHPTNSSDVTLRKSIPLISGLLLDLMGMGALECLQHSTKSIIPVLELLLSLMENWGVLGVYSIGSSCFKGNLWTSDNGTTFNEETHPKSIFFVLGLILKLTRGGDDEWL